jgi:tripartite-type tricarboxylate transporter receptor subunit TctC
MLKILKSLMLLFCLAISPQLKASTMENIKVVVPYPAGSGPEKLFRIMQMYGLKRNINFIPEFKPGANGLIGAEYTTLQPKDGKTLLLTVTSDLTYKAPVKKVDYTDFVPVSLLCTTHMYLVANKKFPANNLTELTNMLKRDSQSVTIVSSTFRQERLMKDIFSEHGIDGEELRLIPFNATQGLTQVIGGNVDIGLWPATLVKSAIDSNHIKILSSLKANKEIDAGKNLESIYDADHAVNDGFGIFLAKGASHQMVKFWQDFMKGLKQDKQVQALFVANSFIMQTIDIDKAIKEQLKADDKFSLTFRQQQIARLIINRGLSNEQIASTLNLSESTVKLHAGIVYKKHGVQNRTQLVAMNKFG